MSLAGPPKRGDDPLNIWIMAAALVAAAIFGAVMGFAIDFASGDNEQPAGQVEPG